MQDAALEVVVFDARFGAQRLELIAAIERQRDDVAHIVARPARRAFAQETQAPVEQRRIPAQAKKQRRILAPHHGQRAQRCVRIGPGLGMRNGNLSAVGETGFEPCAGLTIDDGHLMTGFGKIPGTADANDTGAENHDFQNYSCSRTMRTTSEIRRRPRINKASC